MKYIWSKNKLVREIKRNTVLIGLVDIYFLFKIYSHLNLIAYINTIEDERLQFSTSKIQMKKISSLKILVVGQNYFS